MSWHNIPVETRELYARILTPLQLDVIRHRANRHSWRSIAHALGKDEATIRGHHRRALERIDRNRRKESEAA